MHTLSLSSGVLRSCALAVLLSACSAGAMSSTGSSTRPEHPRVLGHVSPTAAMPTQSDIADLVDRVSDSVVNITTITKPSGKARTLDMLDPGDSRARVGAGTGFVIDPSGYVVTNAHVIEDAGEVTVNLRDDREFTASIVGRDRKIDLALLKIDDKVKLTAVSLGDSAAVRVGESVVAVGNPFGLGHTVTMGIVSAKARAIGAGPYDDFIQTDASINPGNSGGPLFNLRGEVVGINSAIRAGADGIGFAIPVNSLKDILPQLKDKGYVERGKLGLAFQPITGDIAEALGLAEVRGALVSEIVPDSSASRAGIEPGDVIIAVDGVAIHHAEELPRNVARHGPGAIVEVTLVRDGKEQTVKATLDKLAGDEPPPARLPTRKHGDKQLLGIQLENENNGVRVVALRKPIKGLRAGDLIVAVNATPVSSVAQLKQVIGSSKKAHVLFKIRRGGQERFVGVPLGS